MGEWKKFSYEYIKYPTFISKYDFFNSYKKGDIVIYNDDIYLCDLGNIKCKPDSKLGHYFWLTLYNENDDELIFVEYEEKFTKYPGTKYIVRKPLLCKDITMKEGRQAYFDLCCGIIFGTISFWTLRDIYSNDIETLKLILYILPIILAFLFAWDKVRMIIKKED